MDELYMKRALHLAELGRGKVNPNPMVGAVIVKNRKIIGEGYHRKYGKEHAEVNALNSLIDDPEGACLYVTLEPCSHYGKTPPCADKIIESGISRVVIGTKDPNPLVSGRGIKKLIDAGIEVKVGVLEEECKEINKIFIKYIKENLPYVILKAGMSLDGKIATVTGESKWITSNMARLSAHKLRNDLSAIMVGVNTVIADNPKLTCRITGGCNPTRIVVDTSLRIPVEAEVVTDEFRTNTIIATTEKADKNKLALFRERGVQIIITPLKDGRVDLKYLMSELGKLKIDSILVEGGAELNFSCLNEEIVDEVNLFIAPKIIGGINSKSVIAGKGVESLADAFMLDSIKIETTDSNICIKGLIKKGREECLLG